MNRLLITADCSFTFQLKRIDIIAWPKIISNGIGLEVLNISKSSNSNQEIESQIIDSIVEHKEKDLIVMVLWNDSFRLSTDLDINLFEISFNSSMLLENERLSCGNPNQRGHERIAEMFIDQYLESIQPTQRFVYE